METRRPIPLNQQFFNWLARELPKIERGAIHLEIEHGQLIAIACHGHRFLHTPEELEPRPRE